MGSKIRILSPDGGGNRGIIPATIMVEIESRLQKKSGQPDSRLSDYFDLIAGTSTRCILTGYTYVLMSITDQNTALKKH